MKLSSSSSRNRIIFILSLIGIAIAVYVTQSFLRKTGVYCLNAGGCEAVRKAPQSYIFGFFPVPAVGLIGYCILAVCAFFKTMNVGQKSIRIFSNIMAAMALFGVIFVTWFTYTEIFVIKGICTWCAISAVNMYGIFALIATSYLQKKSDTV